MEKGYVQYVSGWMFSTFELQPTLGRLFTADDESTPGASPYAVISYNYWTRRFANDPSVLGRSVHIGGKIFQIIGVGPKSFTGIEPGTITDIFLPTMMNPDVTRDDSRWLRSLVIVNLGVPIEPLRAKLDAVSLHFETERAKGFVGMSQHNIEMFLEMKILPVCRRSIRDDSIGWIAPLFLLKKVNSQDQGTALGFRVESNPGLRAWTISAPSSWIDAKTPLFRGPTVGTGVL
jgi:hypothetical protein